MQASNTCDIDLQVHHRVVRARRVQLIMWLVRKLLLANGSTCSTLPQWGTKAGVSSQDGNPGGRGGGEPGETSHAAILSHAYAYMMHKISHSQAITSATLHATAGTESPRTRTNYSSMGICMYHNVAGHPLIPRAPWVWS